MTHSRTDRGAGIYREAAENMARKVGPEYSCWAINWVASNGKEDAGHITWGPKDFRIRYESAMLIGGRQFISRKERILALCFMAAMVEAGDA